jgi:NAD(P)-dependent dehydrogenase (short-subunit alcohol dehydrogenase family)
VSKPETTKGAVCITGASGGIGVALVPRLLEEGYAVSAWDLAPGPLASITHDRYAFRALDTRDTTALAKAVAATREQFGAIHGLVSLAAVLRMKPFLEIDDASWDEHFSINLKGSLFAVQAVLPVLREQKSGGIVLFSSSLARTGGSGSAAYTATKGGILGLARSLALEVARDGIRVNTVSPGLADTAMPRGNMGDNLMSARAAGMPMKRLGMPIDMAEAAIFLLDAENSFMVGQDVRVAGGALVF